jgi:hypothetical protein
VRKGGQRVLSGALRPVATAPPSPSAPKGARRAGGRSQSADFHPLVARPACRNPTEPWVAIPDVGGDHVLAGLKELTAAGAGAGKRFDKLCSSLAMSDVVAAGGAARPMLVVLALVPGLAGHAPRGAGDLTAPEAGPVHAAFRRCRRLIASGLRRHTITSEGTRIRQWSFPPCVVFPAS